MLFFFTAFRPQQSLLDAMATEYLRAYNSTHPQTPLPSLPSKAIGDSLLALRHETRERWLEASRHSVKHRDDHVDRSTVFSSVLGSRLKAQQQRHKKKKNRHRDNACQSL